MFRDLQSRIGILEESIDAIDSMEEFELLNENDILTIEQAKVEHVSLSLNFARKLALRVREMG